MLHKLGKHPKVVDRLRRTLQIRDYLDLPSLPPPPPSRDWTCGITNFGEMLNNQLSDCVAAAAGHMIQVWTAANGQEITVPDSAIQQAYQDVGGYVPGDPSTDNGMDMLSFLKYWRTTGVGGHKIFGFAEVNIQDAAEVQACINLFGGLYLGFDLPTCIEGETIWTVVPGPTGVPGSLGGHCVTQPAFNLDFVISWAIKYGLAPGFAPACCDEAYVVLPACDWAVPGGKPCPSGFLFGALQSDLKAVTA